MKMNGLVGKRSLAVLMMAGFMLMAAESMCQETAARPTVAAQKADSAFEVRKMIANGWPVLSVLLLMSVVSVAITVERYIVMKRAERETDSFFPSVLEMARSGKGRAEVLAFCETAPHSVSDIVSRMINESDDRESMLRAAQRMIQIKVKELESHVATLGTVANTAPFVGLLGTVIGIIKAFQSIAAAQGGGPEVVAAGISEALITTAFGLFVAIPAVVLYNHLGQRISRIATEMDVCTSELADTLTRKN
jgi:biopolymer transport protein ExbB